MFVVDEHEFDFSFGCDIVTDISGALHVCHLAADAFGLGFEDQLIAGGDRPEAELFDEASGAWLMLPHPMAVRRRGMVFTTLPAASNLDGRAMAAGAHLGTLNW